ncbi:MAG: HTH-like domain protein [Candidatus Argoarchaeum ethanivorans]|uniref:HTH-like domain protein n=1 Tax=Candidatus Argoarchaeum ethanivorans TaxID=2608793 RepID=A0A811TGE1_9EURY|nr:MAG: HTH-like domain protein [Candidatus Argoarchaeum ethanivorans]
MIESLDTSRSGYYKWLNYSKWHNRQDNYNITPGDEIQKIAIEFTGYGYRRITVEPHNRNFQVNHKKVNRIMKEDTLVCVKKRFRLITTDSNHGEKVYKNLAKNLKVTHINQL